jgi:hypothetical protein
LGYGYTLPYEGCDVIGEDGLEVRMFVLADWAAIPPDGKLYIGGAGISSVKLELLPGVLPPLHLVVRIRVPWQLTSEPLPFSVRLLDADRQPLGLDPLAAGTAETGRPPGARPGDELAIQFVLPLGGLPASTPGIAYFHLIVADEALGILPLKIERSHP